MKLADALARLTKNLEAQGARFALVAYGWYGEAQAPETYVSTHIGFGRAIR